MNRQLSLAAVLLAGLAGAGVMTIAPPSVAIAAPAAEQTRTFVIKNMTCATCPITVKTAMSRVAGVKLVKIDFNAKTATVTYDPSFTTPARIAAASTDVGYPARPGGS